MRFLVSIPVALVSSAVALLIAAVVLDGFDISTLAFPVLVVEFALILVIARAAIETLVDRNVQVSSCFAGLIGAFAALLARISSRTGWTSRAPARGSSPR